MKHSAFSVTSGAWQGSSMCPHIGLAQIYTGLGDKDRAVEWWNKAQDEHSQFLIYFTAWPANDRLRSDRRYRELLHSMGYPGT